MFKRKALVLARMPSIGFIDHIGLDGVGGDIDELDLIEIQEAMADLIDVLAEKGLATGNIEPDQLTHGVGDFLNVIGF